ncbi:hypothetical protein [Kitasatospora sp. NPDC096204]|uniref:hypothetical protein n=1 Tax=Kitasatospora sp. NPDC096204 TaxID=3364094 RepID=UPI00380807D4
MSVSTWWWIVALVTVLFWALAVPPQPIRKYRIMVSLAPLSGALFLIGHLRGTGLASALSMYALALLSLALGTAGHLGKLSRRHLAAQKAGDPDEVPIPAGLLVQLFLCLTAGMVAYFVIQP